MKPVTLVTGCLFLLSGCGVLQSEGRIEQVGALRADYDTIDLKTQIETPRNNRKKLLDEQLALIDSFATIMANGAVRSIATATRPEDTLEAQLAQLAVTMGVIRGVPRLPYSKDQVEDMQVMARKIGLDLGRAAPAPVDCTAFEGDQPAAATLRDWAKAHSGTAEANMMGMHLPKLEAQCRKIREAEEANTKAYASVPALREPLARLAAERDALRDIRARSAPQREKFTASLRALEQAQKDGASATIGERAADVARAFDALKKMEDAFSVALLSAEKIKSIDTFLADVGAYDPAKKNLPGSRPALAALFFSELFREIGAANQSVRDADWSALVAQRKVEKAQVEGALREIAIRQQRVELLEQAVQLRVQQLDRFAEIETIRLKPGLLKLPTARVLHSDSARISSTDKGASRFPTTEDRVDVHRVIAYTIDAGTRMAADIQKTELRLHFLDSEIMLGYSEASIHQWAALLDANVASLEASHKAALTGKQINDFVNSALLFWIGKGTN